MSFPCEIQNSYTDLVKCNDSLRSNIDILLQFIYKRLLDLRR
ncbi:hypothetical protein B4073_1272 [Bacillus subtilis]|nr:hypothetical protein B4068_1366 [Bacillus subtilis]KIN57270.1 hypothetical protein B4073_1272 [Bacillus subtilis]